MTEAQKRQLKDLQAMEDREAMEAGRRAAGIKLEPAEELGQAFDEWAENVFGAQERQDDAEALGHVYEAWIHHLMIERIKAMGAPAAGGNLSLAELAGALTPAKKPEPKPKEE